MFATVIRTIIIYVYLMAVMRLTGKRQIGQMQPSELVTAFLLSELAALPISDVSIPLVNSILPIALIISLEVVISFLSNRIPLLKRAVECPPSIVIKKGVIDEKELCKIRMGIDELLSGLRLKDISDISEVDYAILEGNGQLSTVLKSGYKAVTVSDMQLPRAESGVTHPLIISGNISNFNLSLIGQNKKWLFGRLGKRKVKDILLMTIDDMGKIQIIDRSDKQTKENKSKKIKGRNQ